MGRSRFKKRYHIKRCSFCHSKLDGLPHRCKYCGYLHCHEHLIPENHNCKGMSNKREWGRYHQRSWEHNTSFHQKSYPQKSSFSFRLPRIRVSSFFKSLILAILTYFLASQFNNALTLVLEFTAWCYFAIIIYKKAFRWANRVSMGDDLAFWGLRLLGAGVVVIGVYIGFFGLFATMFIKGSAPTAIPLFVLLLGLVLFGLFIVFRTNRRHSVVGIWRA